MTLAERLERALSETPGGRKLSKKGLAQACGIAQPSVTQWFNGRTKALEGGNLLAAARYLEVSPEWLATGKGAMRDAARLSTGLPTAAAQPVRLDIDRLALALAIVDGAIQDSRKRVPDLFRARMIARVYEGQHALTGDTADAVKTLLTSLIETSEAT